MGRIWADQTNGRKKRKTEEYRKVYAVHSFSPSKGSRRKPAWEGIRKKEGARWYVLKYASKYEQKEVPKHFENVGRFWAHSSDVPNKDYTEVDVTEDEIREYLASKGYNVTNAPILPKLIIDPK